MAVLSAPSSTVVQLLWPATVLQTMTMNAIGPTILKLRHEFCVSAIVALKKILGCSRSPHSVYVPK